MFKALAMVIKSDSFLLDKSSYLTMLVSAMPKASATVLFVTPLSLIICLNVIIFDISNYTYLTHKYYQI